MHPAGVIKAVPGWFGILVGIFEKSEIFLCATRGLLVVAASLRHRAKKGIRPFFRLEVYGLSLIHI